MDSLASYALPGKADIQLGLTLGQLETRKSSGGMDGKYSCTIETLINNAENASVDVNGVKVAGKGASNSSLSGFIRRRFFARRLESFHGIDDRSERQSVFVISPIQERPAIIDWDKKRPRSARASLSAKGFLSWQDCQPNTSGIDDGGDVDDDGYDPGETCTTKNPGFCHCRHAHASTERGHGRTGTSQQHQLRDRCSGIPTYQHGPTQGLGGFERRRLRRQRQWQV